MNRLLVALTIAVVLFSCSENPNTPIQKNDFGSADITFNIGKIGTLGKIRTVELSKLYIALNAPGEASVYDTFNLSGNGGGTYTRIYGDLASLFKTWTLTAATRDVEGTVIHSGTTQFIVPVQDTVSVTLTIDAKYSMLKANFYPIRDSVTRCELWMDCTKVDDSSFTQQSLFGDTVTLSFNYLDTGISHRIKLDVYGNMWGVEQLLYAGDTLVTPRSGIDMGYSLTLKWVGPATPPPGQAYMNVILGAIGTVSINGELENIVTDIDGNVYHTVRIGSQVWMVENLKTTRYNDGSEIQLVTDSTAWEGLSTPGYCWLENDISHKEPYGALYNWYAVNTNNLAPEGWHVPTDQEWTTLENYLIANGYNWDGTTTENKIAKSMAVTTDWTTYSEEGTSGNDLSKNNRSGFSAFPGGCRWGKGAFLNVDITSQWWSATENDVTTAWSRVLYYANSGLLHSYDSKKYGFSVRCLKE